MRIDRRLIIYSWIKCGVNHLTGNIFTSTKWKQDTALWRFHSSNGRRATRTSFSTAQCEITVCQKIQRWGHIRNQWKARIIKLDGPTNLLYEGNWRKLKINFGSPLKIFRFQVAPIGSHRKGLWIPTNNSGLMCGIPVLCAQRFAHCCCFHFWRVFHHAERSAVLIIATWRQPTSA